MVFRDLNVADLDVADNKAVSKLAAKLACKMLPDCPHLALRERVMASLCQSHPVEALTCGVAMLVTKKGTQQQKMSPSCYDSMLLALSIALHGGRVSATNSCSSCLELCVHDHQAYVLFIYHPDSSLAHAVSFQSCQPLQHCSLGSVQPAITHRPNHACSTTMMFFVDNPCGMHSQV